MNLKFIGGTHANGLLSERLYSIVVFEGVDITSWATTTYKIFKF